MATDIASLIRSARRRNLLSQGELAAKAGIATRTVWAIENGTNVPQGRTLRSLARALDLDTDQIAEFFEKETA